MIYFNLLINALLYSICYDLGMIFLELLSLIVHAQNHNLY